MRSRTRIVCIAALPLAIAYVSLLAAEGGSDPKGEGVSSVQDRPCEHGGPIAGCDTCRYEVGLAKIEPNLAGQLIRAQVVSLEAGSGRTLELTGQVQFDLTRIAQIGSPACGRVLTIRMGLGDRVQTGQVLAVVLCPDLGQAQAANLQAKARLDLAGATFQREQGLYRQKVTSQADMLSAEMEFKSAQAEVAVAGQRLGLFGPQANTTGTSDPCGLGQWEVRSPLAGQIIEQPIMRGQWVEPAAKLFRIADLSWVWVWCDLYERDLDACQQAMGEGPGLLAEVRVDAYPDRAFEGRLDLIGAQVDEQTRTIKVRIVAANPQGLLKPGMFANARVSTGGPAAARIRVPASAVFSDAGQSFVFERVREDLWARRDVRTGRTEADRVEILDGLSPGSTIAATGGFMLKSEVLKEKMGAGCAD